jgi:hypothetical protein
LSIVSEVGVAHGGAIVVGSSPDGLIFAIGLPAIESRGSRPADRRFPDWGIV